MKKIILVITIVALMAAWASAQEQPPVSAGEYKIGSPFEADLGLGYRFVNQTGSPLAGEYDYLHSSAAGKAIVEWDPLPHRFLLETYVYSSKEYFGEIDYAYKDVVMFNLLSRSLWHNTEHINLGVDDPATANTSIVDFNPLDAYGIQDMMNRAQVRFKTPDFPFHIYLEAKDQEKKGTIQQRFLRYSSLSGVFNRASETRDIDYQTNEAKATVNSHLGPVELEYSHSEKKFRDTTDKFLTDTTSVTYAHNLVPTLDSSNNTIKLHTSHAGRIAAALTYSSGDKENKDSNVKATYSNAAADLTIIPHRDVTVSVRYRHYEMDQDNPSTTGGILGTVTVRDALSTTKDNLSAFVRYRATQSLTLRAELIYDDLKRDFVQGSWNLDPEVKKSTLRLGGTYRLSSRFMVRGDYTHMTADVPANSVDNTYPSSSDSLRALLTWNPAAWFNLLLSGGTSREERSPAGAPFAGDRTTDRNRAMGSMTFLLGKKTSLTPGYAYYQNKSTGPIVYTADTTNALTSEDGVPYADTTHIVSLSLAHAISDVMTLTADVSQSHARGNWRNSGVVAGSTGIAELTDLKMVENEIGADLSVQFTKNLGTDLRYSYRNIDNKIDDTLDGTNQITLAMLTYKW